MSGRAHLPGLVLGLLAWTACGGESGSMADASVRADSSAGRAGAAGRAENDEAPGPDAAAGGGSGTRSLPSQPTAAAGSDAGPKSEPDAGLAEADSSLDPDAQAEPDAATEPGDGAELLTQRYDNARTGANLNEATLTPARASSLRLLGSWPVDGEIYAQVLVASDVEIQGRRRAVAIVATMNDSVYAFDADADPAAALLWQRGAMREFGTPGFSARNVGGLNGILSTPVIDKQNQQLFLVARDCDSGVPPAMQRCGHRLLQLDLASGETVRSVMIRGEVELAAADGGTASTLAFEPSVHWARPGLLLAGDQLVVSFGSGPVGDQHEEDFVYHGWVFRYDATDLARAPEVYCTTPRGRGGSVWQAGAAPAADDSGIFFTGANGIMDDGQVHPPLDWPVAPKAQEDSVIRLERAAQFPTPQQPIAQYWDARDYRAEGNVFQSMESGDNGFGSSGPMLIPDSNLLLVGSKAGLVYLLNRETMQATQEPLNPFQDLPLQPGHTLYLHSWWGIPVITQAFVFWRVRTDADADRYGYAFAWASDDKLRSLRFDYQTGELTPSASADVPVTSGGGNLVLSALGDQPESGILWAATRSTERASPAGQLWAIDPRTLGVLWRTETPAWSKFTPPSVLRGRVFLPSTAPGAAQQVLIYGLSTF